MPFTSLRRDLLRPSFLRKPFSLRDQCSFASQLSTLLNAGLPLLNSLSLLRQSAPLHWRAFISQLETQLRQGDAFSTCLRQANYELDHSFISLVEISERSGQLGLALDSIATKLKTQMELRQEIQQALAYPCITVASALFLFFAMAFWVIPIFRDVFAQFHAELPWATQVLLQCAAKLQLYFLEILCLFSALAVLSNNPTPDLANWLACLNRRVVAVYDNDVAGRKLAKFGHQAVCMDSKDLGDSSDAEVTELLKRFG